MMVLCVLGHSCWELEVKRRNLAKLRVVPAG